MWNFCLWVNYMFTCRHVMSKPLFRQTSSHFSIRPSTEAVDPQWKTELIKKHPVGGFTLQNLARDRHQDAKAYKSCKEELEALHVIVAKKAGCSAGGQLDTEEDCVAEQQRRAAPAILVDELDALSPERSSAQLAAVLQSVLPESVGHSFAQWLQSAQSVSSVNIGQGRRWTAATAHATFRNWLCPFSQKDDAVGEVRPPLYSATSCVVDRHVCNASLSPLASVGRCW